VQTLIPDFSCQMMPEASIQDVLLPGMVCFIQSCSLNNNLNFGSCKFCSIMAMEKHKGALNSEKSWIFTPRVMFLMKLKITCEPHNPGCAYT